MEPEETTPDGGDADSARLWSLPTARRPVPELVEERVLELLRSGDLRLGDRLPNEPELARLLGVGRSSVRTALQKLQNLGVVEVNRGRGWFISGEPRQQAADLMLHRVAERGFGVLSVMEVRIMLEGSAAALAAVRASPGQLDTIGKLCRTHQDTRFDDRDQLLETDEAFHAAIVDASANPFLQAIYEMVVPLIADWRRDSYATPEVHERSGIDHNQIVVQLRRRDEVGARLAMTAHLMGLYKAARRESGGTDPEAELSAFVDVRDNPLWSSS